LKVGASKNQLHRIAIIAREIVLNPKPTFNALGENAWMVTEAEMQILAEALVKAGYLVKTK
jgi:hypothetical protein